MKNHGGVRVTAMNVSQTSTRKRSKARRSFNTRVEKIPRHQSLNSQVNIAQTSQTTSKVSLHLDKERVTQEQLNAQLLRVSSSISNQVLGCVSTLLWRFVLIMNFRTRPGWIKHPINDHERSESSNSSIFDSLLRTSVGAGDTRVQLWRCWRFCSAHFLPAWSSLQLWSAFSSLRQRPSPAVRSRHGLFRIAPSPANDSSFFDYCHIDHINIDYR